MLIKFINKKNIFLWTRFKLDLIVAIFVSIILIFFSFGTYKLLTIDIIYQISPIFKDPNISNSINTDRLFNNFKLQTIFFLSVSDIVIFILSIFFFDKMVKKMLTPIEYLSNLQTKFAEHVSHELRTPLSILKLHTEILEDKIQQEKNKSSSTENIFLEKSEKSIQDILKEIENIKILINDLLFEARLRYGEQKKDKITLKELQDLILEIVEKANYFKNKDVKFFLKNNFQDEDLSKFLSIFKKHLERVFNNLISNSFKFTENGKVEVDLEIYKNKNKKYLKIQIFDTGLGIKKSDLKKVSERFYRGENVENKISGTGIGLSIVKDVLEKYNWKMSIESQENEWTKIEIKNIYLNS